MEIFNQLLLFIVIVGTTVAARVNSPSAGNTRSQLSCHFPFPAGLPRFVLDPPATYYPIGDAGTGERLMVEIGGNDRGAANFSTFLKMGCPRRDILFKNDTVAYYHLTSFGDKSSLLQCHFPNPLIAELDCPSLDGNSNKDFTESITHTDRDTFIISVRCYPALRLYTWIAQSNVPTLSPEAIREIRQHVTGLGFNWNKAKPIRYDRCPPCQTTY